LDVELPRKMNPWLLPMTATYMIDIYIYMEPFCMYFLIGVTTQIEQNHHSFLMSYQSQSRGLAHLHTPLKRSVMWQYCNFKLKSQLNIWL
jgi:hypothetical protein